MLIEENLQEEDNLGVIFFLTGYEDKKLRIKYCKLSADKEPPLGKFVGVIF